MHPINFSLYIAFKFTLFNAIISLLCVMEINYVVRLFTVFRNMHEEITYFLRVTVMGASIYSGSLCIYIMYTYFIIFYNNFK